MINKPIKILLIEDNEGDRRIIEEMFSDEKSASFELVCADCLSTGISHLGVSGCHAVLLDLMLPDSTGLPTLSRVQAQAPRIPILVLTGFDDEMLGIKAVQQGAQDYLVKGYLDSHLLVRSIRYAIERKRAKDALQKAHDEMERRVEERTAELVKINEELQLEIKERKQAEKALRESEKQLRHLSFQLLTTQENERKQIAQELHDSIGQYLSAIKFGLENILHDGSNVISTSSIKSVSTIISTVQNCIGEVRKLSTDLWPSILDDLGILATISWFCREFQAIYTAMGIEKQITAEESEIPKPLHLVIYRVLQEAFNNIANHSKANLIHLSLIKTDGSIELTVSDNGSGFDLENCRKGLGLASMKERVGHSGGFLTINSVKGTGTTIQARWSV